MKDTETRIEEIKTAAREFMKERKWEKFHTPKDLAIAVSVEAAEILEHFRFRDEKELESYLADEENKKELGYEMADVLSFLVRLAEETGIDLANAVEEKMKKNSKRYPVGTASGNGWMKIKRDERR